MITKAEIKNFQSLKDVTLEFGRVTSIIGDSDQGKSAFVRALRALVLNRTSESLMHKKKGPLSVKLFTDDGHTVEIERANGKSAIYKIDGKLFVKTGKDIPDEVGDLLHLREYKVDKDERILPCIQTQLGPQFLIQHTDAVVSKTIGRISNVSIVFSAIRKAQADILSSQQDVATLQAQVAATERDLLPLATVEDRETAISALRVASDSLVRRERNIQSASAQADGLSLLGQKVVEAEVLLRSTSALSSSFDALDSQLSVYDSLSSITVELQVLQRRFDKLFRLEEAGSAIVAKCIHVSAQLESVLQATYLKRSLESTKSEHNRVASIARAQEASLAELGKEAEAQVRQLKLCPLLEDEFKDGCVDKLISLSRR